MPLINSSARKINTINYRIIQAVVFLVMVLTSAQVFGDENSRITRMDFVMLMASGQSESPLLAGGPPHLSKQAFYRSVVRNLDKQGFKVLNGKGPDQPLSQLEFIRLTYAFSGQPAGRSIFEQKLYLKQANILESADIGLTTAQNGRVVRFASNGETGFPTELASPIFMQDRIETDLKSQAMYTLDDGSALFLDEDAIIYINEHIYDPDRDFRRTIVRVALGTVRFIVTKGHAEGSMFQVITPTATAGVRGTEFVVTVLPNGLSQFIGFEGKIETFPNLPGGKEGKHEFVTAGQHQTISNTGASSGVLAAPSGLLKNSAKQTSPSGKQIKSPFVSLTQAMQASNVDWVAVGPPSSNIPTKSAGGKGSKINPLAAATIGIDPPTSNLANQIHSASSQTVQDAVRETAKDVSQIQSNINVFEGGGLGAGGGFICPNGNPGPPCGSCPDGSMPPCGSCPGGGSPPCGP